MGSKKYWRIVHSQCPLVASARAALTKVICLHLGCPEKACPHPPSQMAVDCTKVLKPYLNPVTNVQEICDTSGDT
eukprot:SAG11_NODE_33467_length_277_cov_0.584270_1_plen_74_part_10